SRDSKLPAPHTTYPLSLHDALPISKIVRTIVATNDWALFGTRVSRLRMKCVRQRCQAAPGSVAAIASTNPGCASELTSLTPARPDRKSTRLNSSHVGIPYAGLCLNT